MEGREGKSKLPKWVNQNYSGKSELGVLTLRVNQN